MHDVNYMSTLLSLYALKLCSEFFVYVLLVLPCAYSQSNFSISLGCLPISTVLNGLCCILVSLSK